MIFWSSAARSGAASRWGRRGDRREERKRRGVGISRSPLGGRSVGRGGARGRRGRVQRGRRGARRARRSGGGEVTYFGESSLREDDEETRLSAGSVADDYEFASNFRHFCETSAAKTRAHERGAASGREDDGGERRGRERKRGIDGRAGVVGVKQNDRFPFLFCQLVSTLFPFAPHSFADRRYSHCSLRLHSS